MNVTLLGAGLALAAFGAAAQNPGGFSGPDAVRLVTAAEVAALADDTQVRLEGYIARSLGDEKYEFKDDSGTVLVEIDAEDWRGVEASPSTRLELRGEVDREGDRTEVDVDTVRLLPQ